VGLFKSAHAETAARLVSITTQKTGIVHMPALQAGRRRLASKKSDRYCKKEMI